MSNFYKKICRRRLFSWSWRKNEKFLDCKYFNLQFFLFQGQYKLHECVACHKLYPSLKDLTYHFDLIHMNIRPYPCRNCDKRFHNQEALTVHIKQSRVCLFDQKMIFFHRKLKEVTWLHNSSFRVETIRILVTVVTV
jgi:NAD-dependent SIR2 family protein deacetylase